MTRSSSRDHTLADLSDPRLERLLCEWANLLFPFPIVHYSADEAKQFHDAIDGLHKKYKPGANLGRRVFGEHEGSELVGDLWLGSFLRLAWNAKDLRTREWYLYKMRDGHNKMARRRRMTPDEWLQDRQQEVNADSEANAPPPKTLLVEQAIYFFQRKARRARRCANVECPAPYFFAKKRNQRYCTDDCAIPAALAVKRRWWAKHRAK